MGITLLLQQPCVRLIKEARATRAHLLGRSIQQGSRFLSYSFTFIHTSSCALLRLFYLFQGRQRKKSSSSSSEDENNVCRNMNKTSSRTTRLTAQRIFGQDRFGVWKRNMLCPSFGWSVGLFCHNFFLNGLRLHFQCSKTFVQIEKQGGI